MAEETNNIIDLLRDGKVCICPNCKKGKVIPYNTTVDKAHSFYCERDCGFIINCDPIINIE